MKPLIEAPRRVRKALADFGGSNVYGKPLWRVVLSDSRERWFGGRIPRWPKGNNDSYEYVKVPGIQGVLQIPTNAHPIGWDMGPQYIPMYPCTGWILERWQPPHVFGSRWDWEHARDKWGDLINGPFPTMGDYFIMDGPWDQIPGIEALEASIARAEHDHNNRPTCFEMAIQQMLRDEEAAEVAKYERIVKELEDYSQKEISPMFNRISLNAQRVRDDVQKRLGVSSHLGAGQR